MISQEPSSSWGKSDSQQQTAYNEPPSFVLNPMEILKVVAAATFLLESTRTLAAGKARRASFSGGIITFLVFQLILFSGLCLQLFWGYTKSVGELTPLATFVNLSLVAELLGCAASVAHICTSQSQIPRVFYTLTMLTSSATVAFLVPHTWTDCVTSILYCSIICAEFNLRQPMRLRDASAVEEASLISRVNFAWLDSLFPQGTSVAIDADVLSIPKDISPLPAFNKTQNLFANGQSQVPGFWHLLLRVCAKEVILSFAFELADIGLKFAQPWILKKFLRTQNPSFISVLFVVNITDSIVRSQASYNVKTAGLKLRSGIALAIFEKTLLLPPSLSDDVSITNLTEVDIQRLQDFTVYLHAVWSAPLQVAICLISIALVLGWDSAAAGVASMLILMPLYSYISMAMGIWQGRAMSARDARISLTSEILYRIKTVKLYGQQLIWAHKINQSRAAELKTMERIAWLIAAINVLMRFIPMLISIAAFGVVLAKSRRLSSEQIFPALAMFMMLVQPMALIPIVTGAWTGRVVSYRRLQAFLALEELPPPLSWESSLAECDRVGVTLTNVGFTWPGATSTILTSLSLSFSHGKLISISGPVGSGKSTVLQLMMGILKPGDGHINLRGTFAYVQQNEWLFTGTVRDNIVMNNAFDFDWYTKVVQACALDTDFRLLAHGDLTAISSIGVAISGGQKSRITLARAAYSKAQIVFFDAPLPAVDNNVRVHLVNQVLGPHGILQDRLRIVTDSSSLIYDIADESYVIRDGEFRREEKSEMEINMVFKESKHKASSSALTETDQVSSTLAKMRRKTLDSIRTTPSAIATEVENGPALQLHTDLDVEATKGDFRRPTLIEDISLDRIRRSVYWRWILEAGVWRWLVILLGMALAHGGNVVCVYFLKMMANPDSEQRLFYMAIYSICGLVQAILTGAWLMMAWYLCELPTSYNVHSQLVCGTLQSPMHFFDRTPIGQVLNRFTNDVGRMDSALYGAVFGVLTSGIRIVAVIVILVVTTPFSMLYIIPLLFICLQLQRKYIRTCLQLKRMDTASRSPLLNNLEEIQTGAATIRAFCCAELFRAKHLIAIQRNLEAQFSLFCLELWLIIRLEFYSLIIQTLSTGVLVYQNVDAGTLGLVMSFLLQVSGYLTSTVLLQTQVESEMVSVQRIFALSDNKPEGCSEGNKESRYRPPAAWPTEGNISFKNFSASYAPGEALSLRNLSLNIKPREKIAVVGRTGAGKSSFALAMLRILEAREGSIEIDGVDISHLDIEDLRSRISIIPQDCQAFTGSVRMNLDPNEVYDDSHLLRIIKDSYFDVGFESAEEALEMMLVDGGFNISSGQRQLLALARAMLVESKILILDEATAAIDHATEQLILKTVHEYFGDKTTITIAHRLQTVLGSDRLVVLDRGRITEVGSPEELIRADGIFAGLFKEAESDRTRKSFLKPEDL